VIEAVPRIDDRPENDAAVIDDQRGAPLPPETEAPDFELGLSCNRLAVAALGVAARAKAN
jgi:hypothetical protein